MKKYFLQFINILIYIFSFLFLLSIFFKMTSYFVASNEKYVVIIIWVRFLQLDLLVLCIRRFLHGGFR